jgi:hypothetical protein
MSATVRARLFWLLACVLGACSGGGGDVPTSLLLTVANDADAPAPDSVRVRVFDDDGLADDFVAFAAPAAAGNVLGTVVIYARDGAPASRALRVHAQGTRQDVVVSEGTASVALTAGHQASAQLTLEGASRTGDRDGDSVPDDIDTCPDQPNPRQEPGACSGSDAGARTDGPPPDDDDAGTDGPRADVGPDASPLATGKPCASSGQCDSGFCVDNVCCESACTDACRSCNLAGRPGRCAAVPAGDKDPRAGCTKQDVSTCGFDGTCNGSGACRRYPAGTECRAASCSSAVERLLPGICDGSGACMPGRAQSCAPYVCAGTACKTTCAVPADCAPGNATCTNGSCGRKPVGTACAAGAECNSNNCVDGVCCDVADCSGACRSCNVPGAAGSCRNFAANADARAPGCAVEPATTCGRTGKCDGMGACQRYAAGTRCGTTTCMTGTETAAPACDGGGSCVPGAARSCGNYQCSGMGCGTACSMDNECAASAYCQGGTCHPRVVSGTACTLAHECQTGFCVDGHCCQTMSCAAGQFCGGAGGTCAGKKPLGSACTTSPECMTGACADGVCCDSACTDTCRRCSAAGHCQNLDSGRDANATVPCAAPKRCTLGGICR